MDGSGNTERSAGLPNSVSAAVAPLTGRLKLALVLDTFSSTELWPDTVHELRATLAHTGMFSVVRTWSIDTSRPDKVVVGVWPSGESHAKNSDAEEAISGEANQVVLVFSDCIAPAWCSYKAAALVAAWGRRQPVAVIQPLPPEHWPRTALDDTSGDLLHVCVTANKVGIPNASLRWRQWRAPKFNPPPLPPWTTTAVPIPILTADIKSVHGWVNLIRYGGERSLPAVMFSPESVSTPVSAAASAIAPQSPRDTIRAFGAVTSKLACRLTLMMSVAPVSLSLVRIIQRECLPESSEVHLAEVFYGGLIQQVDHGQTHVHAAVREYEFAPGIREELLSGVSVSTILAVVATASRHLHGNEHVFDFEKILKSPDTIDQMNLESLDVRFRRITAQVLERFGGRYGTAVKSLRPRDGLEVTAARVLSPSVDSIVGPGHDVGG